MWLFVPKTKYKSLQEKIEELEQYARAKESEYGELEQDLDMAEECLKTLRENKIDALLCQSLFKSLNQAVEKSLAAESAEALIEAFSNDALDDSQYLFASSRETLQQINEEIKTVGSRAQSSGYALGNLAKNAEKVRKLLRRVFGVAEQTKLLTISAKIDAATMEMDGREIAELAEEMLQASSQAGSVIKEIQFLISEIVEQTHSAQSQVGELVDLTSSIGLTASTVEEAVTEVIWSADDHKKTIRNQQWAAMVRLAQWEHVAIKSALCERILNPSIHRNMEHQTCFFGKWINKSSVSSKLEKCNNFTSLIESHENFHIAVANLWSPDALLTVDDTLLAMNEIDRLFIQFVDALKKVLDELGHYQKGEFAEHFL